MFLYYLMMGYGMFVLDGWERFKTSIVNIITLFILILVNVVIITFVTIKLVFRWCKYKFCRKKCMLSFRQKFQSKKAEQEAEAKEMTEAKYKQDSKSK